MKIQLGLVSLVLGFSMFAQAAELTTERILTDLAKVDASDCDIELRKNGSLRILSTALNKNSNSYYDFYGLESGNSKFEVLRADENSWRIRKEVDLSDVNVRMFPRFLYGKQITELHFIGGRSGNSSLIVKHTPSTMHVGSGMSFICTSDGIILDKSGYCTDCLIEQK